MHDEFMVWHVESYMLARGTDGHAVQKNELSSFIFESYKNFGMRKSWLCWTVSEHRARNYPSDTRIVDVWLTHELKSHRVRHDQNQNRVSEILYCDKWRRW